MDRAVWERPMSAEVRRACAAGDFNLESYVHGSRASLRIIGRGFRSPWDALRGVDGWLYYRELAGFVAYDFAEDASVLNLVAVGILDMERREGGRMVLMSGFMSIRRAVDDILCRAATFARGEWRVLPENERALVRANERIVAALRERAHHVASERQRREREVADRKRRREEDERREAEGDARREAAMEQRCEVVRRRARARRLDTREQVHYTQRLKLIGEFMRDKPIYKSEWTQRMWGDADRAGIHLTLSPDGGGEYLVNAVYPEPPDADGP